MPSYLRSHSLLVATSSVVPSYCSTASFSVGSIESLCGQLRIIRTNDGIYGAPLRPSCGECSTDSNQHHLAPLLGLIPHSSLIRSIAKFDMVPPSL